MKIKNIILGICLLIASFALTGCGSATSSSYEGGCGSFRVSGAFGPGIMGRVGSRLSGYSTKFSIGAKVVTDVLAVFADGYDRLLETVTTSNFYIDIDPGKALISSYSLIKLHSLIYTPYRIRDLYEKGGEEALREISRKKPLVKNRVPEATEKAVINIAVEYPAYGQLRASNELKSEGF